MTEAKPTGIRDLVGAEGEARLAPTASPYRKANRVGGWHLGKGEASLAPTTGPLPLGEIWVPGVRVIVLLAAAAMVAVALFLGRDLTFYNDEWDFVFLPGDWSLSVFMTPHNEHWSAVPVAIYKVLLLIFGLRTHLPYLAALVALHALVVLLLFTLLRRRYGDLPALAGALLLLVLGRGYENILWAFQVGFVSSAVFGLAATTLLDRPRPGSARSALASLALLLSVMSSTMGLLFCLAVGVELLLDRHRRSLLPVLALPAIAYAAWFASFGASAATHHHLNTLSTSSPVPRSRSIVRVPSGVAKLPSFVPYGLGATLAALAGLPAQWGMIALAVGAALLTVSWMSRGRWLHPPTVAGVLAATAMFSLAGLARSQLGVEQAAAGRYLYMAAVFLIPVLAEAASRWRAGPRALGIATILLAGVMVANGAALVSGSAYLQRLSDQEQQELQALTLLRSEIPIEGRTVFDPDLMPQVTPDAYFRAVHALGSPVPVPADLCSVSSQARARVVAGLHGPQSEMDRCESRS